jgi:hypothetical protein
MQVQILFSKELMAMYIGFDYLRFGFDKSVYIKTFK